MRSRGPESLSRRCVLGGSVAALTAGVGHGSPVKAAPADLSTSFAAIERQVGGRLGIAFRDTGSGLGALHRANERFPLCSTFKLLAAAAILARVDVGQEQLDRRVRFERADVVVNSPVTERRVGRDGMALAEICEAAITMSDNTAGNLMLASLGGPIALTRFARSIGDPTSRLDRIEPALNEALPDDPRDTTSPAAMLADMHDLVLGQRLLSASRQQLTAWLLANTTGETRIRAGLPAGWRVGDKTGAGEQGTTNDVGIVWPPGRAPLLLAMYLTGSPADAATRNAALASVTRAVVSASAG